MTSIVSCCAILQNSTDGYITLSFPISGFVGTVFVNAISNLLVTVARNTDLSIQSQNDAQIVDVLGVLGGQLVSEKDGVTTVRLGGLQSGQPRDVVVRMKVPKGSSGPYLSASLSYDQNGYDGPCSSEAKHGNNSENEIEVATCRLTFIDAVAKLMETMDDSPIKAKAAIKQLAKDMKSSSSKKRQTCGFVA
eukprot:TRINITY_DN3459_c0_g1_i1.p1 TRINITY_DN3459_c0_g1~~TRINITY_DN3459_c0_g1_i1.p1  ORF type:complete len:192 (-),score=33.45 TRINITY_DN3459_c0_g1_i1:286-861(-)